MFATFGNPCICHMFFGVPIGPLQSSITSGLGCRQSKRRRTRLVLLGLGTSDLAKMGSGPKLDHLLYIEDDISYLVICGDDISHSGLGPIFFCIFLSVSGRCGGVECAAIFLRRFFLLITCFFHQSFCVCGGTFESRIPPLCPRNFMRGLSTKQGPIYFDLFKVMLCFL